MAMAANRPAPEIETAVMAHQRAMNASRFIPETPEIFRRAAEANRVYIFNVGPWSHVRELGSAGTFRIPACPADRDYSDPLVIDGVVNEPYPINEVECKLIQSEGAQLAGQIIGEGPFIAKSSSFVPYGVFVSTTPKPSKEQLAAANAELQKQHLAHIRQANAAFMKDPSNKDGVIQQNWHFVSAHALKKTKAECPWLGESLAPAGRDNCPGCGAVHNVGILKCRDCGYILDKPRYDAAKKAGMFAE
jgi:hypothetical protein